MAGQAGSGSVGKLTDIHGQYKTLFQGIQEFQLQHSHIKNVDKFLRYCRMGSKNRILKIELVGSIPGVKVEGVVFMRRVLYSSAPCCLCPLYWTLCSPA